MTFPEIIPEARYAEADEAYIRYCAGLAMIQAPHETTGIHNQQNVEEHVQEILVTAQGTMIHSIKRVLWVARAVNTSASVAKAPRFVFENDEPVMRELLDHSCTQQEGRLAELNPWYPVLRPAPFLDKLAYNKIGPGKYDRVTLATLMDGFVPHELFAPFTNDRVVAPQSHRPPMHLRVVG